MADLTEKPNQPVARPLRQHLSGRKYPWGRVCRGRIPFRKRTTPTPL